MFVYLVSDLRFLIIKIHKKPNKKNVHVYFIDMCGRLHGHALGDTSEYIMSTLQSLFI